MLVKKIDNLKHYAENNFTKMDPEKLEKRMVARMNDAVTVLTREMADKHETRKNFKVFEK